MDEKELVALLLLTLLAVTVTAGAILSSRFRDLAFFGAVTGMAFTDRMDVNFFSHWWYRGTTRGIEISVVDILAFGVLAACIVVRRQDGLKRLFWPRTLGLLLIYTGYCVFSICYSDPKVFGICELSKVVRGIILFLCGAFYIRTPRELTLFALALGTVAFIETAFALRQRLLMGMTRVAGTVNHPNSLSMYMCLIAPILVGAATSVRHVALRYFLGIAAGLAAFTTILTLSRTGVAVCALTLLATLAWCCSWKFSFKKFAAVATLMLCGVVLTAVMWPKLKARYLSASLTEEYIEISGENRGIYIRWALMMGEDHPFGVGLNNWSYWVSKDYGDRVGDFAYGDYDIRVSEEDDRAGTSNYAPPAHNLLALTLGELGRPGLAIFGLLWLRWMMLGGRFLWRRSDPLARWGIGLFFGIVAVFLHNFTEWVYRQTTILFTLHLAIGAAAALLWLSKHPGSLRDPDDAEPPEDFDEDSPIQSRDPNLSRI